jgi:hypothetical protein
MLRIGMFIPDPGSRVKQIPDPESAPENLSTFYQSGMFIPDLKIDILPIPNPGSRIKGSKRHRIPDTEHCCHLRIFDMKNSGQSSESD